MFGRVRDFARRHRGKLIGLGVAGGVAYAVAWYARRRLHEWQDGAASEMLEQTKKRMHFEATRKTCAETTGNLMAALASKVDARFNADSIIAEIRAAGAASSAEKRPLWDRLKVASLCRAFAGVYGAAMLSVLVRVQLGVVGGYMFVRAGAGACDSSLSSSFPLFGVEEDQEEYLAAMKRFVDVGFASFCDELQRLVAETVSATSLKDKLNFDRVTALTYSIKNEVDALLQNRLVDFMYPEIEVDASNAEFPSDPNRNQASWTAGTEAVPLAVLVQETRDVLENPDVFSLIRHLTQMGTNEILDALAREWIARSNEAEAGAEVGAAAARTGAEKGDGGTSSEREANANVIPQRTSFHQFAMPFVKLLPLFAGFGPGQVLQDMSRSEQLNSFAANVYETFSVPPTKI